MVLLFEISYATVLNFLWVLLVASVVNMTGFCMGNAWQ